MEDKDILSSAMDVLTTKPATVTVDLYPANRWERLLTRLGLRPQQRVYELRPILVGNLYRIAAISNQLPANIFAGNLDDAIRNAAVEHLHQVIYIVAVGIQNNRHEPSKALLESLRYESVSTLAIVLKHIMQQLNLSAFMQSIVLIKGMNILPKPEKTSPMEPMEIIASATTTTPGSLSEA